MDCNMSSSDLVVIDEYHEDTSSGSSFQEPDNRQTIQKNEKKDGFLHIMKSQRIHHAATKNAKKVITKGKVLAKAFPSSTHPDMDQKSHFSRRPIFKEYFRTLTESEIEFFGEHKLQNVQCTYYCELCAGGKNEASRAQIDENNRKGSNNIDQTLEGNKTPLIEEKGDASTSIVKAFDEKTDRLRSPYLLLKQMQDIKRHLERKHKLAFEAWQEEIKLWDVNNPISRTKIEVKPEFGPFSTRERRYFNAAFAELTVESNLPGTFCETKGAKKFVARFRHLAEFRQMVNNVNKIPESVLMKPPVYKTIRKNIAIWSELTREKQLSLVKSNRSSMRELGWPESALRKSGSIVIDGWRGSKADFSAVFYVFVDLQVAKFKCFLLDFENGETYLPGQGKTALAITQQLMNCCKAIETDHFNQDTGHSNVFATFVADGASVNAKASNSLGCARIHCACHRLALAMGDVLKSQKRADEKLNEVHTLLEEWLEPFYEQPSQVDSQSSQVDFQPSNDSSKTNEKDEDWLISQCLSRIARRTT